MAATSPMQTQSPSGSTASSFPAPPPPPPPPAAPTDPTLASKIPTGAYPLTLNNLSQLVRYSANPAGLSIRSLVSLPAGTPLAPITTATPAASKRWSTVQTSATAQMELNSALLYMNHSCAPSVEVDVAEWVVRVARDRDLSVGDEIGFFYPSTEWDMDAPFHCLCGQEGCLGLVRGARYLAEEEFGRRWMNEHVVSLRREEEQKKKRRRREERGEEV